jgi:hypothetical protein
MKEQYERETGKQAMVFSPKGMSPSNGYVQWLEDKVEEISAKAEAYDRLMSGGKKTLKEWANIFGLPFAVGYNGQGIAFKCKNLPIVYGLNWWPADVGDFGFAFIDSSFIDYTGDWKDSLTLPDGWEAQKC